MYFVSQTVELQTLGNCIIVTLLNDTGSLPIGANKPTIGTRTILTVADSLSHKALIWQLDWSRISQSQHIIDVQTLLRVEQNESSKSIKTSCSQLASYNSWSTLQTHDNMKEKKNCIRNITGYVKHQCYEFLFSCLPPIKRQRSLAWYLLLSSSFQLGIKCYKGVG